MMTNVSMSVAALLARVGPLERLDDDKRLDDDECLDGNAALSSYSGLELFDGLERDMTMNTDVSTVSTRAWQHFWYVLNVSNVSMASAV